MSRTSHRIRLHRRLAFQLGAAVAVVCCLTLGTVGWLLLEHERTTLTRELTLRVLSETRSLALAASSPLLRHDPELGLHPLILRALDRTPDLVDLIVVDSDGVIVGHQDLVRVDERIDLTSGTPLSELPQEPGARAWIDGEDIVISRDIVHLDQPVGSLVARVGRHGIEATVRESQRRALWIAGLGLAVVVSFMLALVRRSLRPLAELREGVQRIGSGDLSTRMQVDNTNELGMLSGLINEMATGLEQAQADLIQKERLDHELAIARDLQSTLLPGNLVNPEGYELATHYTPALEVSGDYYDLVRLDGHRIAVITADVSGKGVPGLVVMAMLRMVLRGLSHPDRGPVDVLKGANRLLEGTMRRAMFVTCLYGILDNRDHMFRYASAGHCPPALFGANRSAHWLDVGGKPIGLFERKLFEASLTERIVQLGPGDGLLLYTDGLVEAMDDEGNQLGEDEVLWALDAGRALSASKGLDSLLERVREHRRGYHATDDLTLVSLRRGAARPAPAEVNR